MEPKIIFFDIDGTLLNHATGVISPVTREALIQLHKNGYLLCIASGRGPASFPDLDGLPFDAFCSFNGSLCYNEKEIIHSNPIFPKDVAQIIQNAASIGRPVAVAAKNRIAANGVDKDLFDYFQLADMYLTASDDFDQVCQEDIYQIMIGHQDSERDAITQNTENIKLARSWPRAVDVIPGSSDKGAAIAKILAYYNLDASQALAFGDSFNDIEMLQTVGTGVAMGNAPESVKDIANDVCDTVTRDGIYHYCIQHGLF